MRTFWSSRKYRRRSVNISLTDRRGTCTLILKKNILRQIPYGQPNGLYLKCVLFLLRAQKEGPNSGQVFPGFSLYLTKVENWKVQVKSRGAFLRFSSLHILWTRNMCPLSRNDASLDLNKMIIMKNLSNKTNQGMLALAIAKATLYCFLKIFRPIRD